MQGASSGWKGIVDSGLKAVLPRFEGNMYNRGGGDDQGESHPLLRLICSKTKKEE